MYCSISNDIRWPLLSLLSEVKMSTRLFVLTVGHGIIGKPCILGIHFAVFQHYEHLIYLIDPPESNYAQQNSAVSHVIGSKASSNMHANLVGQLCMYRFPTANRESS